MGLSVGASFSGYFLLYKQKKVRKVNFISLCDGKCNVGLLIKTGVEETGLLSNGVNDLEREIVINIKSDFNELNSVFFALGRFFLSYFKRLEKFEV